MTDIAAEAERLKGLVSAMRDDFTDEVVAATAARLEGVQYAPPVSVPISAFLRMRNRDIGAAIDRLVAMPDDEACALSPGDHRQCEDLKAQYMSVLIYYYRKLIALRSGHPDEWDEIDELYIHD